MPHDEWDFPEGQWENADDIPAGTPPIVRHAFEERERGRSWTEIGRDLGMHRSTAQRWATGNRPLPPETRYISRVETQDIINRSQTQYRRNAARRQLDKFAEGQVWTKRATYSKRVQRRGRRSRIKLLLGRESSDDQARRADRVGGVAGEWYRERYPRYGDAA